MTSRPALFRRPLRSVGSAFLAAWLAGCAAGPDYTTPEVAVPAQYGSTGAETTAAVPQLSEWWRR